MQVTIEPRADELGESIANLMALDPTLSSEEARRLVWHDRYWAHLAQQNSRPKSDAYGRTSSVVVDYGSLPNE